MKGAPRFSEQGFRGPALSLHWAGRAGAGVRPGNPKMVWGCWIREGTQLLSTEGSGSPGSALGPGASWERHWLAPSPPPRHLQLTI